MTFPNYFKLLAFYAHQPVTAANLRVTQTKLQEQILTNIPAHNKSHAEREPVTLRVT